MKVHHLDCCTMCPVAGRWLNEERRMVAHCLLVETDGGLVLVDTGIGLADVADPRGRLGGVFDAVVRPVRDESRTARRHTSSMSSRAARPRGHPVRAGRRRSSRKSWSSHSRESTMAIALAAARGVPAASTAARTESAEGWPGCSPSGRLQMTLRNPAALIAATSSGMICPETE